MGERAVGFRHPLHVFFLFERIPFSLCRRDQFVCQPIRHGASPTLTSRFNNPSGSESKSPFSTHGGRNLIIGAPHAPRAYLKSGRDVLHRILKHLHGITLCFVRDDLERRIHHLLSNRLLSVVHDVINKLREIFATELWIRVNGPNGSWFSTHSIGCARFPLPRYCARLGLFLWLLGTVF